MWHYLRTCYAIVNDYAIVSKKDRRRALEDVEDFRV